MTPLCQRRAASCGACCGLYNRVDHSRPAVEAILARHTEVLAGTPRTEPAFRTAAARLSAKEEAPLFPSVRLCPLLGYLDPARSRIGCLAHPLVTGGADLRTCGAYDVPTCEGFLCPSHSWFSEAEAELVEAVCGEDWYLYGLTATDVPFVRAALGGVAALTGVMPGLRHLEPAAREDLREDLRHRGNADFRRAMRRLFALKEELLPGSDGLYGAFRPGPDGDPVPRQIDYAALGRDRASAYDALLTCMGADPRSGNDLEALEAEVRRRLDACARAMPRG
ncbi:hypothetical protein [Anaeromyxobacter paludicola]|uniref:YkgJ family cysteine cluster protein n=1 Tax=Anaeromyxobacter paludicola TaxID=2918171 RepID=A0ABM7XCX6_9BACT|nr:hypothetical protein [Anaeromyxobacter paludicola]BDG09726.1 hypothetical protein AMPC_28390 [Anaeromyxobacter paludicola]